MSPPNPRPTQRRMERPVLPRDWGFDMTVCIAAITRNEQHIVAAADLMLSDDEASAEPWVTKIEMLTQRKQWLAMFTGDPSVWNVVRRRAADALDEHESLTSVKDAFEDSFQQELEHHINVEVLRRWKLDVDSFRTLGRDQLGDHHFTRLAHAIEGKDLCTEAMLAGFEPEGAPRIFTAADGQVCVQREHLGFHAIGAGAFLALAYLYSLHDDPLGQDTLPHLVYRVCEAKFQSERAPGVGRRTIVLVLGRGGRAQWMHPDRVDLLRKVWEPRSRPSVPKRALDLLRTNLTPAHFRIDGVVS